MKKKVFGFFTLLSVLSSQAVPATNSLIFTDTINSKQQANPAQSVQSVNDVTGSDTTGKNATGLLNTSRAAMPEPFHRHNDTVFGVEIPDLGAGTSLLDQQQETQLGEMVLRQIGKEMPLYQDPWTQDELSKIFSRIYSASAADKASTIAAPLGLVIIDDNSINAFAVPGGLFALNTGLVLSVKNIDELAGVMGHEVAHVSQRHYSRSKEAFKNQTLITLGSMLASILLASQSSDAAGAVALGAQAAMIDRQLSYSRNQEREADRIGMQLMYAAGYNPSAMADFFETMNRKTGTVSFMPDFWLTHPLSTERMSEARLRAAQYPKQHPKHKTSLNLGDENNLHVMQYRMAVLSDQVTENRLVIAADRDPAAVPALALFYARAGKYEQARGLAKQFAQKQPEAVIAAITQTEIELMANQPQQALEIILLQNRIMPENRALAIYTARAYSALGKGQAALELLQPLVNKNPRDLVAWQTMEAAASRLPESPLKTLQVLRFRAETQFWQGDVDNAIRSLMRASKLAQNNYSMQAKLENRLNEMQEARKFRG
ncbi:M48 family metalloprotease [Alkanindiges illinoisensis]|uniref:M48 family metalloprotease n=1 Tax=Alkanindiges illinoisensis TaxID=197183 RepID=UPI000683DF26|nr:M48 family metalloprotease [Alkanindiges illinoisensis]